MRAQVEAIFNQWINATFRHKPNLSVFFMKHERKQIAIDNICQEIVKAEQSNIGHKFDKRKWQTVIEAGAKMFCDAAIKFKEQQLLSEIEKQRQIDEAEKLKKAEECLEDVTKEDKPTSYLNDSNKEDE